MNPIYPAANTSIASPAPTFTWDPVDATILKPTDPYEFNLYNEADCGGEVSSTTFSSVPSYTFNALKDGAQATVSMRAHLKSGSVSVESCSHTVTGKAIISQTRFATGAYLSLEVDLTHKLAYAGANYGSEFFDTFDFTDETAPVMFRATATPYTYSRGLATYKNGSRLIVVSEGANAIVLYDLTSNPRTGTWTALSSIGSLGAVRRVIKIDTSNPSTTKVYLGNRTGVQVVNISEPAGTSMSAGIGYSAAMSDGGSGAVLGDWVLTTSGSPQNAYIFDYASLTLNATVPLPAKSPYGSYPWTAASNSSGSKGFAAGLTGAFFSYNASTPGTPPVQTYRYSSATAAGGMERDAAFVTEDGKELMYSVRGNGLVETWDVGDISHPLLIHSQTLSNLGTAATLNEPYGIKVDPVAHRAYVVTAGGWFFILDTRMLQSPVISPIAF